VRPRHRFAPTSGNPAKHVDPKSLPTPGDILAACSENRVGGEDYEPRMAGPRATVIVVKIAHGRIILRL
jgi:hypothetical protein